MLKHYGRIVNCWQNVWKERLDHSVLMTPDIANNPRKDIAHRYVPSPTSTDLTSPQRVRVPGSLTDTGGPSTPTSRSLPKVNFDEAPSPRFRPQDDRR